MNELILVVDDKPDVELLFRQRFRQDVRAGRFTMEFAPSGLVALQRIADVGGAPLILILSDINMPGMSGLELLPKARAARPDVPVIMITAYGDEETNRQRREKGAKSLLTKPIDFAPPTSCRGIGKTPSLASTPPRHTLASSRGFSGGRLPSFEGHQP